MIRVKKNEDKKDIKPNFDKGYMSKNKLYNKFIDKDNRQKFNQYDIKTGKYEKTYTFKRASAIFRMMYGNKIISRIQKMNNISRKEATQKYKVEKENIKNRRIDNILAQEPKIKTHSEAVKFYDKLIRKGNYTRIKKYGS